MQGPRLRAVGSGPEGACAARSPTDRPGVYLGPQILQAKFYSLTNISQGVLHSIPLAVTALEGGTHNGIPAPLVFLCDHRYTTDRSLMKTRQRLNLNNPPVPPHLMRQAAKTARADGRPRGDMPRIRLPDKRLGPTGLLQQRQWFFGTADPD